MMSEVDIADKCTRKVYNLESRSGSSSKGTGSNNSIGLDEVGRPVTDAETHAHRFSKGTARPKNASNGIIFGEAEHPGPTYTYCSNEGKCGYQGAHYHLKPAQKKSEGGKKKDGGDKSDGKKSPKKFGAEKRIAIKKNTLAKTQGCTKCKYGMVCKFFDDHYHPERDDREAKGRRGNRENRARQVVAEAVANELEQAAGQQDALLQALAANAVQDAVEQKGQEPPQALPAQAENKVNNVGGDANPGDGGGGGVSEDEDDGADEAAAFHAYLAEVKQEEVVKKAAQEAENTRRIRERIRSTVRAHMINSDYSQAADRRTAFAKAYNIATAENLSATCEDVSGFVNDTIRQAMAESVDDSHDLWGAAQGANISWFDNVKYCWQLSFGLPGLFPVLATQQPAWYRHFGYQMVPSGNQLLTARAINCAVTLVKASGEEWLKRGLNSALTTYFLGPLLPAAVLPIASMVFSSALVAGTEAKSRGDFLIRTAAHFFFADCVPRSLRQYVTGASFDTQIYSRWDILLSGLSHGVVNIVSGWMGLRTFDMTCRHATLPVETLGGNGRAVTRRQGRELMERLPVVDDVCLHMYKTKVVPTQRNFHVKRGRLDCRAKFGTRKAFGVIGVDARIHRSCTHNEQISLNARVGKLLPMHESPKLEADVLRHWTNASWAVDHLLRLVPKTRQPVPFESWIVGFNPRKKQMYRDLRNSLMSRESLGSKGPPITSSFIKREKFNRVVFNDPVMVEKDPRMIQGAPPEFQLQCGPIVRMAALKFKKHVKPRKADPADVRAGRQIVYTSGLSNERIGREFRNAITAVSASVRDDDCIVFLEDDQSRFDLHLTEGAFKCLDRYYSGAIPKSVRNLLRRGKSRGRTALGTRYSVDYTMQSGYPDTAFADTTLNSVMKLVIHGVGNNWVSIICGDDSVTVTTRNALTKLGGLEGIMNSYAAFGMEVVAKVSNVYEGVEFCSARFMAVGNSFILVPKVGKLMARMGYDTVDRPYQEHIKRMRGVGQTLRSFGAYCPIMGTYGTRICNVVGDGPLLDNHIETSFYERFSDGTVQASWADILLYFAQHYQFVERDVLDCIGYLNTSEIYGDLTHPLLVEIAVRDSI